MILVDTNLLLYTRSSQLEHHAAAKSWLDTQLSAATGRVGLPWQSLNSFVRIITNPRVFPRPETVESAWAQVREWLARPQVWTPVETPRHQEVFERMLSAAGGGGNLIPDAHLAALAMEHGLVMCSTDGDFARFPGLRWENPLRRRA